MSYIVDFGNNRLSDYCSVLNVKRTILPTRSNFQKDIPTLNGSYYTGFKYAEKQIVLEIAIYGKNKIDYMEKITKLSTVLDVKNPVPLIINDEPYKCYYAVPVGDTSLNKFAQSARCEITFICHDPLAYSLYWNTYMPSDNIFSVESYGTADTYPIIDVDFNSDACFFQLTNPSGETVLIGTPTDVMKTTIAETNEIINDNCQASSNFSSISEQLLDSTRKITGQYGVGLNGNAMICTNYGDVPDTGMWGGCAFRRNLNRNLSEFEVEVDVTFSSKGENYVAPKPSPPVQQPPTPTPPSKPSNPTNPPAQSLGTYKVVNCGGLYINKTPDTSQPLYAMAPGTHIYPTEIRGNWAKHTHSNQWNTFTGWSSMKYLQKVSNSGRAVAKASRAYAEDQLGIIEIYGFDQNGAKLFKMSLEDSNKYYEYVMPRTEIGNTIVLRDDKATPTARKITQKDSNGKETTVSAASGVFGDWNDFEGKLSIKREKNALGEYAWTCSFKKIKEGKIEKILETSNSLSNSSYPKGDLNYLAVFIGKYKDVEQMSVAAVNNILVKQLNINSSTNVADKNVSIFSAGDHLQVNFEDGLISLNDRPLLNKLDIGSEFFAIPPGNSQFIMASDATKYSAVCGFKDRFL